MTSGHMKNVHVTIAHGTCAHTTNEKWDRWSQVFF